ncbi:MAG: ABC transporter permease [Alphaproteobacteria bacterium]|nr:ABC transporter permease [Alphaproteobacteria bacterium]
MEYLIQYSDRFIDGTIITIQLLVTSSIIGLAIAVPMALARVSRNPLLAGGAYVYIYILRGTPLLVQLYLVYFGLGQFEAVRESVFWPILRDEYWCGMIGLTLNTSAYVAEILRGGIMGVPHGEVEAARAAGMSQALMYRRIILPKAFRIAWPAYGNEVILLLKGSALVSTITVLDLMGVTRTVFSRSYSLDLFLYAAILYFVMTFVLTRVFRMIERHLNRHLQDREQIEKRTAAQAA